MKKRETMKEFIERFFTGAYSDYVEINIIADDILPIRGNKEQVLKKLEGREIYFGEIKVIRNNYVEILGVFKAYY